MHTLIISHNTRSAGTLTITRNLIDEVLINESSTTIITLPSKSGIHRLREKKNIKMIYCYNHIPILGVANRLLFDLFVVPYLIFRNKPAKIIALGNYFINFSKIPAKILVRHPYLLEDQNKSFLNYKQKIVEYFRSKYFQLSVKTASHILLQSAHMLGLFRIKYPGYVSKASILPNPISPSLAKTNISKQKTSDFLIIYPSRYYPHKNHQFLLDLVTKYKAHFIETKIKFLITINTEQKSSQFILDSIRKNDLSTVLENIGEIKQSKLFDVYGKCNAIIFPSQAETFGNGLVEGLFIGLPVIAPDLPYAKTILKEAGVYYKNNDLESAHSKINKLIQSEDFYKQIIKQSKEEIKNYPSINKWWAELCS